MINGTELDSSLTPFVASLAPARDYAHSGIYLGS
jgi:hypothetical protein